MTVFQCLINPPAEDSRTSTLVGGFNPSEKYSSKWVRLPQIGVKVLNKCVKPPPSTLSPISCRRSIDQSCLLFFLLSLPPVLAMMRPGTTELLSNGKRGNFNNKSAVRASDLFKSIRIFVEGPSCWIYPPTQYEKMKV